MIAGSKAGIFNASFVEQCSMITTRSTLLAFRRRAKSLIQNLMINREKVLQIIESSDPKKAHGCDEVSIATVKM